MVLIWDFDSLPRMIKPLTLETVKRFFRVQAKTLAKKVTVQGRITVLK